MVVNCISEENETIQNYSWALNSFGPRTDEWQNSNLVDSLNFGPIGVACYKT